MITAIFRAMLRSAFCSTGGKECKDLTDAQMNTMTHAFVDGSLEIHRKFARLLHCGGHILKPLLFHQRGIFLFQQDEFLALVLCV